MASARMGPTFLEKSLKYSILTPSRNRPARLKTFVQSVYSLCAYPHNVEILVYVDTDDPAISQYKQFEWDTEIPHNVQFVYGEPVSISKSWNTLAEQSCGDVLVMGNDDLEYRTQDWDILLQTELEKYPDQIYCAWMQDCINGEKHCAFPIISRKWYDTVGYFAPGVFNFGYNDTWVFDIAKRVDRCHYIPHITAEHCHFSANKSAFDDTYARNRTQQRGNLYALDQVIYEQTASQRQADADKLRELCE